MHTLFPAEQAILQSLATKVDTSPQSLWARTCTALQTPTYTLQSIKGRDLQVPTKDLALAHKLFNGFARLHLPPSKGVEEVTSTITAQLGASTPVIRTDISKCFGSLIKAEALKAFHLWLQPLSLSPEAVTFLTKAVPTLFPAATGLSTGSPASPACLDIVFSQLALLPGCFRYVDDFLIINASADGASASLRHIQTIIKPFGWVLSAAKTETMSQGAAFTFLGVNYRSKLPPAQEFSYVLAQTLPVLGDHERYQLTTDATADSYRKTKTTTTYSAFSLADQLTKGSIDALLTVWLHYTATSPDIKRNIDGLLCKGLLKPLHSNLWRIYIKSVKTPRDQGQPIDLQGAERVLIGLALGVYIASTNSLPSSLSDLDTQLKSIWPAYPKANKLKPPTVLNALKEASTGAGAYHCLISALFKVEWQLREGHKSTLPSTAPFEDYIMSQDELPTAVTPFTDTILP